MTGLLHSTGLPEISPLWREHLADALLYDPSAPLQIASPFMLAVLPLFLAVAGCLHRRRAARNAFTALFSLYLYYKLSGAYVLLLLAVAVCTHLAARLTGDRTSGTGESRGLRGGGKTPLVLCVVMNVAVLVFFKAGGLFSDFIGALSHGTLSLRHLAVPAGVSFFCFQSISYVADTYRGTAAPLKRFTDCLLLLSFFPKMFLGPLVRNRDFIAQIQREDISVSREDCGEATRLIVSGLVKFCILSKIMGQLFVAPAFSGSLGNDGFTSLAAVYVFTFQLYCDFSGYTDLASGISLLAGYRLPLNFDFPYRSATVTEFWRRWHISLSSWLRDYLYNPLGGSRRGTARTYLNLLITMFLGGLWHGVGLMFALWGLWHGLLLCLHKLWMKAVPGAAPVGSGLPAWRRAIGVVLTFNAVAFGWLMFRSPDWTTFTRLIGNIAGNFSVSAVPEVISANAPAFAAASVACLLHCIPSGVLPRLDRFCTASRLPGQALLIALAIWLVLQCDALFFTSVESALPIYANF